MWKIRTRGFTLQEVLIMAAMNVEPTLVAIQRGDRTIWKGPEHREPLNTGVGHGKSN
jgi:hypothetical protein